MHINSKLRYIIDLYGIKIWIEGLYTKYKKNVLKVENSHQISEEKKKELIKIYEIWIKILDLWINIPEEAKKNMLEQLKEWEFKNFMLNKKISDKNLDKFDKNFNK